MHLKTLKIATRNSPLALCQTNYIYNKLLHYHPNLQIKLIPIITIGDLALNKELENINRKGLFIKELEYALLNHHADIAVHSMKDVSISFPKGLGIAVICKRDDPRDAFVSLRYSKLENLPNGAIVGTSSLRRQCQLYEHRPDLKIKNIRGNIDSRLKKLNQGHYDALILATAGLKRLSLNNYIRMSIDPANFLPAMGQGALGIEYRLKDDETLALLKPLHHQITSLCIETERNVNFLLKSNCKSSIASYAEIKNNNYIWLRALIYSTNKKKIIRSEGTALIKERKILSIKIARELIINSK
ncbi:hydroxymethylbilane synthase [Blochmannia endosymbiont of Colobopsis nipponica]|uniref:hydroxymethylbilane synthase n=1 Tax=Blochmannia endosymbiont of Colobopsis nipponica TaxID=2681987 RepID=UPI00177FD4AA|nr:hydroxymethylbilane synthase [Blochmannia endosymbiont of Colobopsis nipponica]QOI10884.1 hydroxymethylbilane synthase [Blochmannia endosymbiont of Colobopsis nipponica]QOI10894.1 hydroxymethylbilane synthase [Blochmannia endosymbiont of Colobopsis nipponica]